MLPRLRYTLRSLDLPTPTIARFLREGNERMTTDRGTWKSNWGFILAAVGSAVGLGNIWRFSYLCHQNGGAVFLIPYVIALLTTGIPIMILEFAIGHKMRASAPKSFHAMGAEWEWLGWWPVMFVMFGIELYYTVVIAWCLLYALSSGQALFSGGGFSWEAAEGTESYFLHDFLGLSGGVFEMGGIQWPILAAAAVIWVAMWLICVRRVDRGVEIACKIFIPILLLLTAVLVVWGLTLEGAGAGIKQYMRVQPEDWAKLGEVKVWRDAFGQIFFSLSIGFGIMIAYASYLPKKTDLVKSAMITAFGNCGFSVFAGFAVYAVLGYMAVTKGVPVNDVAASGPGLCFIVYPEAISLLPAGNALFGLLFFSSLVLAGLTSAISILEAFASAGIDKFGWSRFKSVTVICFIGAAGSLLFTFQSGLFWLDIVDHFLNQYGLIVVGLLECLVVVWYYRIDKLHFHLTDASEGGYPFIWDVFWEWTVKYVAPLVLAVILAWSAAEDLTTPYEGYDKKALILLGLGWVAGTFLIAGFFSTYTKRRETDITTS